MVTASPPIERAFFVDSPEGASGGSGDHATRMPTDIGVVICPGGWYGTSTNRNRVVVRLSRAIANLGHTVVRFDWHGVGDSSGEIDRFVLDRPFVGDVVAVCDSLSGAADRLLVIGVCFGGRSALAAAPQLEILSGLVLVSFPFPAEQTKADWRARKMGWRGVANVATNPELWRPAARWATRRLRPAPAGPKARQITSPLARSGRIWANFASEGSQSISSSEPTTSSSSPSSRSARVPWATTWSAPGPGSRSRSPTGAI